MSAKAVREYDGKRLLFAAVPELSEGRRVAQVRLAESEAAAHGAPSPSDLRARVDAALQEAERQHPWLLSEPRLVVKPDQLIKRRGKASLLLLDRAWPDVKAWVGERAGQAVTVGEVSAAVTCFVVEPFVEHEGAEEHYVCMQTQRDGDEVLWCTSGGVDVGDVDAKGERLLVPVGDALSSEMVLSGLKMEGIAGSKRKAIDEFLVNLHRAFVDLHFTYLEVNPLVVTEHHGTFRIDCLDLAGKIDQTAEFEAGRKWAAALGSPLDFPAPFGRTLTREEAYIEQLDGKTGASLKLTVLNPAGRIWTMVAGGGASVAYADAIAAAGFAQELANYGEYSGAPSETQTFEYSRTVLDLMTRGEPHVDGKVLLIGGGIANFTNVATTFRGIIRALTEYRERLAMHRVALWVRRGGPNYQEGLRAMRDLGDQLALPISVFGPETHITAIVPMALGVCSEGRSLNTPPGTTPQLACNGAQVAATNSPILDQLLGTQQPPRTPSPFNLLDSVQPGPAADRVKRFRPASDDPHPAWSLFTPATRAFVHGLQLKAVQGMLDYDYICQRGTPSVAAMIYPFGGHHMQKFYWGTQETLIPVYPSVGEACAKHGDVSVLVNFASCRSVLESVNEALGHASIRTIAVIAEGVPERHARIIAKRAREQRVTIIGPATVGGVRAGAFKIGNTGGMIDNILHARLYRPGSVCYVSKSGGMSNELNNVIARCTDGVLEGVAIGGDRFPGGTFVDHLLRFELDPQCRLLVVLGEVGGGEEYRIAEAIRDGRITKPVIAWCIGTCADLLATEVQFGHAGAMANSKGETARAKNAALKEAGALVPDTFEALPDLLASVFTSLVRSGDIVVKPEPPLPKVPIDYAWASELGLIRKPTAFVSTICDDRGQELLYAGMPISSVFRENVGLGGVVGLLWFRRRLPDYAAMFIEMVLMLTADHGPAVSGAHNTIVAARAGKDLISSLCSGLLTIGERFGGATDGAAEQFSSAYDQGLSPDDFVASMRRQHKLILGIGHKIKSVTNPDQRVLILQDYARRSFPAVPLLDYALQVERLTTAKKDNLILNVDGTIGVLFVDMLRHCGAFSRDEADEFIKIGVLNGLFVLGRSIGFIGHYVDQKQLKQGLYRHPWDDISYQSPAAVDLAKLAPPPPSAAGNIE